MKLTVAIPTYNRGKCILNSLNSIIGQVNDDVEVIVCDNASTDNTEEILQPYILNKKIEYYKAEMNGGMDFNFLRCLENAKGEYILLFSDDDILLPGAILHILDLINKESPDYVNINSKVFIESPTEESPARLQFSLDKDLITYDKDEFIKIVDFSITYLSATIIKKEYFLEIDNPKKYYGTFFLHAHIALDTMNGNKKMVVTKEPYIAARMGNSGGFNLYEVWVKQYKRLLLETAVRNGFSRKTMSNIYKGNINGFIRDSILCYRLSTSQYSINKKMLLVKNTFEYPSVWVKTYPCAYLPKIVLRLFIKLRVIFRKILHK